MMSYLLSRFNIHLVDFRFKWASQLSDRSRKYSWMIGFVSLTVLGSVTAQDQVKPVATAHEQGMIKITLPPETELKTLIDFVSLRLGVQILYDETIAGKKLSINAPHGTPLTRSGVEDRLQRAVSCAIEKCPMLRNKTVSPHTLRHTTAMHLLQAGVDITVIALWLGHESSDTTHQYVEADLEMKKRILNQIDAPVTPHRCKTQSDPLVDFLNRL